MSRTILDVHVLQTVPPSNLNRDDTGTPKTAVYGGVRRARVSSQAWKRATRQAFGALLAPQDLGTRTKRVAELVADRITELAPDLSRDEAVALAAETVQVATGSKIEVPKRKADAAKKKGEKEPAPESSYLMFLSARQRDGLAALAVEGREDIKGFLKDKDAKARAKAIADTHHSVDIALFGRMVADGADINVDAAAQVAHAISVHAVENESDYYTAVDDRNEDSEPGAGMIGTVEFNSATLYRYAAVDVDQLRKNLGEGLREDEPATEPLRRAVQAFVRGFVESLPTGKINTFGNHTLPDAVIVKLRSARPISFVGAFEEPVEAGRGHLAEACARLADYIVGVERAYNATDDVDTWVVRVGERTAKLSGVGASVSLAELVDQVGEAVARRQVSGA
ncbi:type I-E CRISPR-associated protein Cas7/Cse4/CasC [Nocardiopsis changdeensis]|uniref:Type I-E CRISPR-associated protein Cas7/Cse4/CasC n=1 Tax=Nocardiopsis changdeensis TaxID=2831969 RepID=A0ABX8BFS4_9ACTN|nr:MULTISPECIES: type I-E CRISPR-associated protein Cas7/Cse4/CasC [Nocardiopsis]QUX21092.1 type I-E CRISPR-associated protein Cas7/Cse4/CasC [Nocardiopsis changdeensis]QYX37022.1 type I-E CRISPR-associated protein Cas7/Cse4/CasC [Nocardiopsis sp. MT53]